MATSPERQRGLKGEGACTPYGDGRWRARITLKGVTKQKVVNTYKEGVQQLREWINASELGSLQHGAKMTLLELMEAWLDYEDEAKVLALSTVQGYRQKMDAYIRWAPIANVRIDALSGTDIKKFITSLGNGDFAAAKTKALNAEIKKLKDGDPLSGLKRVQLTAQLPKGSRVAGGVYSVSIQRQCYSNIRDCLKWALDEERKYVVRNVAMDYKPLAAKTNAQRDAPKAASKAVTEHGYNLHHEDLMKLLIRVESEQRLRPRWLLALDMGLRPGEALGITWGDIDFTNNMLTIRRQVQHKTGTGTVIVWRVKTDSGERDIPLPQYLMDELKFWRNVQARESKQLGWSPYVSPDGVPLDLVFTQIDGDVISQRLDAEWWAKLLERAKVKHVRRYVARHAAASRMVAMPNADLLSISNMLGHADPAFTLRRYSKALEEKKIATVAYMHEANSNRVQTYKEAVIDAVRGAAEPTEMELAAIEVYTQEVEEQEATRSEQYERALRRQARREMRDSRDSVTA